MDLPAPVVMILDFEVRVLRPLRALLCSQTQTVQNSYRFALRGVPLLPDQPGKDRLHLAALVIARAVAAFRAGPHPALSYLLQEVSLRSLLPFEAKIVVLGVLLGQLLGALPLHAPEVGMDHDDPVQDVGYARHLDDVIEHTL